MFWKSKTKNSGMYNTLSIPANLVNWTQSGTNWNGILTEATMLANNIDYTRVMNVVPQWSQATNGNGWVTTISRSSADNNIYITLTRGSGGSTANLVTLDTNQTITADKQFNGNVEFGKVVEIHNTTTQDNSLALYRENNKANYMSFYNGSTRQGFFGKANASATELMLKAETGDLILDCSSVNTSINVSGKNISNLRQPTNDNHAATKIYVDNSIVGGSWTNLSTIDRINTLNDNFTVVKDYANFGNFTMGAHNTYELMFKCNYDSTDQYCSCILASNAVNYANIGYTNTMYWGDNSGIIFKVELNNNRIKVSAKRNGTNTNWATTTTVYIRKIMGGLG